MKMKIHYLVVLFNVLVVSGKDIDVSKESKMITDLKELVQHKSDEALHHMSNEADGRLYNNEKSFQDKGTTLELLDKEIEQASLGIFEDSTEVKPVPSRALEILNKIESGNIDYSKEKTDTIVTDAFKEAIANRKREEEQCADDAGISYCSKAALKGMCNTHPDDMKKRCKRSCQYCCADDPTYSRLGYCKKFAKKIHESVEEICKRNDYQDEMKIFCPKTCQFCGRASTEIPCARSKYGCCHDGSIAQWHLGTVRDKCPVCKDEYASLCKRFAQHCDDRWGNAGMDVRRWCPLTCNLCGAHKVCKDKIEIQDSCIQMKHEGVCNTFKLGMTYQCAKTCDLCNYSTIECSKTRYGCCADGKLIARGPSREGCPECTDLTGPNIRCTYWKKYNACISNKDRMRKMCAGTCGFCKEK